jgi:hypothetical protein
MLGVFAHLAAGRKKNVVSQSATVLSRLLLGSARGAASLPSHTNITTERYRAIAAGNCPTGS